MQSDMLLCGFRVKSCLGDALHVCSNGCRGGECLFEALLWILLVSRSGAVNLSHTLPPGNGVDCITFQIFKY